MSIYQFTPELPSGDRRTYRSTDFNALLAFAYFIGVAGLWLVAGESEKEIELEFEANEMLFV